jgi:methoxymalonate biosynthesis acyl carrier protein
LAVAVVEEPGIYWPNRPRDQLLAGPKSLNTAISISWDDEVSMQDERILLPIRRFMAGSFGGRDLTDEDDIFALGFGNSLFAIQLVNFVENEFGVEIDSEDLEMKNFCSIRAIANLIERKLATVASRR